jgi:hypothetical protein
MTTLQNHNGLTPEPARDGLGPSDAVRAWADWIIEVHERWHKGDPPPKPGLRVLVGAGGWLLVIVAIIEKVFGG